MDDHPRALADAAARRAVTHSRHGVIPRRLRHRLAATATAVLCVAAVACTDSGSRAPAPNSSHRAALPRDTAPATQTDSLAYHVTMRDGLYVAPVAVTFRNISADTAYFVNCNGAVSTGLQRETAGGWVDAWTSVQDQCLSAPIIVPPSDTLRRRVLLFDGFDSTTATPSPTGAPSDAPAVYRVIWHDLVHHYKAGLPFGTEPTMTLRTSNRFVLTGAPR